MGCTEKVLESPVVIGYSARLSEGSKESRSTPIVGVGSVGRPQ
jgi:hypothetical protein